MVNQPGRAPYTAQSYLVIPFTLRNEGSVAKDLGLT
jgi:hypothetical protein